MAQFQLSRASASDIPEISAVLIRTYEVDPVIRHLFPNVPFDEQLKFYCEWLGEEVDRPWERFWKTIDVETGKIVAFIKIRSLRSKEALEAYGQHKEPTPPEGTDLQFMEHWFGLMDRNEADHVDGEKDYFVHIIGTDPLYRKKGLGTQLMKRVHEDADKDNAKMFLQATPMGAPLYRALGWKTYDEFVVKTPEGGITWECMVRQPWYPRNK